MTAGPARSPVEGRAEALKLTYGHLDALDLLNVMIRREFPGRIAVASSFGAEAAVLLDLVARIDPTTPVVFIDTCALFDETIAYRRVLERHLGLTNLRVVAPSGDDLERAENLWVVDPDLCCHLRKVLPMERALAGLNALVDGRKQAHGGERARLDTIEARPDGLVKISPLARWSGERIARYFRDRGLPEHPLVGEGYASIGCRPCTRPVDVGEGVRDGRWTGLAKTECGIHKVR